MGKSMDLLEGSRSLMEGEKDLLFYFGHAGMCSRKKLAVGEERERYIYPQPSTDTASKGSGEMKTTASRSGGTKPATKGSGEPKPATKVWDEPEPVTKGPGKPEPSTKGSGEPLFKCGSAAPRKTARVIVKCRLSWL